MSDWTGILQLEAEQRHGRTVARNVYFQGAFKVMRPIYLDHSGQACYYILNPGGGYLDGDRYRMKITLAEQAQLTLTTQSATKIYKTPKQPAYQEVDISLKKGSYLEYIADPIIGYQAARYKQNTVIRMERGADLLYSDIITPGWSPDGAKFSYDWIQLVNKVYMDDELVVYDHLKLNPLEQEMSSLGMLEGYSHLGSMMVISEQVTQLVLEQLYEELCAMDEDCRIGVSLLPVQGFVLRVMASSTQIVERIHSRCHHSICQTLFHRTPQFLRKY